MKLRNVNPLGMVDVPLLYRQGEPFDQEGVGCLKPDEEFDTTPEVAAQLLLQPTNFAPADDEARVLVAHLVEPASDEAPPTTATATPDTPTATGETAAPSSSVPSDTAASVAATTSASVSMPKVKI